MLSEKVNKKSFKLVSCEIKAKLSLGKRLLFLDYPVITFRLLIGHATRFTFSDSDVLVTYTRTFGNKKKRPAFQFIFLQYFT